jgi:hypothetical protein
MNGRNTMVVIIAAALVVVGVAAVVNSQPAHTPREGASMGAPHYTVVATEGHNLIVTDNHSNTLYFYTIDKDKEVGTELKLRGSLDLTQAGKPEIRPTTHKLDK